MSMSALDRLRLLKLTVHDLDQRGPADDDRFDEVEAELDDIIEMLAEETK
jgi:hypothetical protein